MPRGLKKVLKMTRINAGIPVEKLSDQHLLAEHREIKRIPNTKFTGKVPERLVQRTLESKMLPRYYGKTISNDEYIKMLNEAL